MRENTSRFFANGAVGLGIRVGKSILGWGGFAGGCVVWGLTVVPITLLLQPLFPRVRTRFNEWTRSGLRLYLRVVPMMRLRIEGFDRVDSARARILVGNHQSLLDPIMLMAIEPNLSGPAKDYLFRWPGLGASLRLVRFYPSETTGAALVDKMRTGIEEALKDGSSLLFFPEGTRSRSGRLGEFHNGAFRMAVEYGLPVQPVVIEGIRRVLPAGTMLAAEARRPTVTVRYLKMVEFERNDGGVRAQSRRLSKQVREIIAVELARMRGDTRQSLDGLDTSDA